MLFRSPRFQRCNPPLHLEMLSPPCTSEISTRNQETSIFQDIPQISEMQPPIASRDAIPLLAPLNYQPGPRKPLYSEIYPRFQRCNPPLHLEMLSPPCTSEISTRNQNTSIFRDIPQISEMQPPAIACRDAISPLHL